jgi:hypothetical protein
MGAASQHDGRVQDDPVDVERHQRRVGGVLGLREGGGRVLIGANGRDMDDAFHFGIDAGPEQCRGAVQVNACRGVAGAVLKHAGAVDHHIDALEKGPPVLGPRRPCYVEGDTPVDDEGLGDG